MKAWYVWDGDDAAAVIFAGTRGKAKSRALHCDQFEDMPFEKLIAKRLTDLDAEYRGHDEMDWEDPQDRRALVEKRGWHCIEDYAYYEDCLNCNCTDICDLFQQLKEDYEEMRKYGEDVSNA